MSSFSNATSGFSNATSGFNEEVETLNANWFASVEATVQFIHNTLTRWNRTVEIKNNNTVFCDTFSIQVTINQETNDIEITMYNHMRPTRSGIYHDYLEELLYKLHYQGEHRDQQLEEYHCYSNPNSINHRDNVEDIPMLVLEEQWFNTESECVKYIANTLRSWNMNNEIIDNRVVCFNERFMFGIQVQFGQIRVYSHISGSYITKLVDCLRLHNQIPEGLTGDDVQQIINTEFADMNEYQVQLYSYYFKEPVEHWTATHTGYCNNVLRVSYNKFTNAVIKVSLSKLHNIVGATITKCRFTESCVLENITFVDCVFNDVNFECALKNVTFSNCNIDNIKWPNKGCDIHIHGDEDSDDERSYSDYEDDM
jgi:hypothetical protein